MKATSKRQCKLCDTRIFSGDDIVLLSKSDPSWVHQNCKRNKPSAIILKRRIRQNIWGNWYGYEGTRRVIEFANGILGSAEQYANEWLNRKENDPDSLNLMDLDSFKGKIKC